jgi:hypothetical protein
MPLEVAMDRVILHAGYYKKKIKNYAPSKEDVTAGLESTFNLMERADQYKKNKAMLCGDGYMPLILSEKQSVRLGTRRELDNMLLHLRNGCCEDPVGVDEINVPLDPTETYPGYIHLCGTCQGESSNRLINTD